MSISVPVRKRSPFLLWREDGQECAGFSLRQVRRAEGTQNVPHAQTWSRTKKRRGVYLGADKSFIQTSWRSYEFAVRSVRSGRFDSHGFRFFLVEEGLAQVWVDRLLQLAHKGSEGLVPSVQAIAYRRTGHHSFLVRIPSLG